MELELDRAQLSYVTGMVGIDEVKDALARSAGAGQACALVVLRAVDRDTGGNVSLSEPGLPARDIPAAALAFALDNWVCAYSAAVMVRDTASIQLLCTAEVIDACTPPSDVMDKVWAPYWRHAGSGRSGTAAP